MCSSSPACRNCSFPMECLNTSLQILCIHAELLLCCWLFFVFWCFWCFRHFCTSTSLSSALLKPLPPALCMVKPKGCGRRCCSTCSSRCSRLIYALLQEWDGGIQGDIPPPWVTGCEPEPSPLLPENPKRTKLAPYSSRSVWWQ